MVLDLQRKFPVVLMVIALLILSGCAGFEYAPKKDYLFYHKELPQAERAVEDAALSGKDKQCPEEFNEAKTLMEKAYETYWACRTKEAREMAREALIKAKHLCPPPPTCELTASPKEIEIEQSSTLTLKTSGKVKSALIDGTPVNVTGGTKVVTPKNSMPYLAHVLGPGGSGTCSASVIVNIPPAPKCELTVSPSEIERGQSATLTLKTSGRIKSAILDNTAVSPDGGTKTVTPLDSTTYIAQCSGPGGLSIGSATVAVIPPPPPVCDLTASPAEIEEGQSTTLTLIAKGQVTSAVLDGSEVPATGGTKTVTPKNTMPYLAKCTGPGGSSIASTTVSVIPPAPPKAELTASPQEIEKGQSSTLTFKTSGKVTSAILDGTEVAPEGGTKVVTPSTNSSYLAHATGPGGTAVSTTTVSVKLPPPPKCELTASPKEIEQGALSTITLKTSGKVTTALLDGIEVDPSGFSKTVSPKSTTPFIASVIGPGGTEICTTTVSVVPPPPPIPKVIDRFSTHVNFDFNKYDIRPSERTELQKVINFVKQKPGAKIYIDGHTDAIGTDNYNQALSEKRADAVKNYLIKEGGINESSIITVGLGETKPIAPNTTDEGRAGNRRAEIVIMAE